MWLTEYISSDFFRAEYLITGFPPSHSLSAILQYHKDMPLEWTEHFRPEFWTIAQFGPQGWFKCAGRQQLLTEMDGIAPRGDLKDKGKTVARPLAPSFLAKLFHTRLVN